MNTSLSQPNCPTTRKIADAGTCTRRFLLKYVMYLSRDPFASAVRRLRGLRLDYGTGFQAELHEAKRLQFYAAFTCLA